MFDKGAVELVWHVMRKANLHMSETLEGTDLASLSVNDRVKAGVQARLSFFAPYTKTWAQAMALGLQPAALPETLNLLAIGSDEVWYWAGDRSTDLNWYTRRVLLMGVMAATETAMLSDKSAGHAETWEFLDRRLLDVSHFGRNVGDGLSVIALAAGGLGSLATVGMDALRPFLTSDAPLPQGFRGHPSGGPGAGVGRTETGAATGGGHTTSSSSSSGDSSSTPSSPRGTAACALTGVMTPRSRAEAAGQGVGHGGAALGNPLQAAVSVAQAVAANAGVQLPDLQAVLGALAGMLQPPVRPDAGFGTRQHTASSRAAPPASSPTAVGGAPPDSRSGVFEVPT